MKVAIYRTCGIGDLVQITPLLQQIRADLPRALIVFFTSGNVADLLRGCPWIDESVTFPATLLCQPAARLGGLPIWRRIDRDGPWDYLLSLEPRWSRAAGSVIVRAARKGGLQTVGWKPLRLFEKTHALTRDGRDLGHASAWYLGLWQRLAGFPDLGFGPDVRYVIDPGGAALAIPDRAVCLAPGAGNLIMPAAMKRWPVAHWLRLAELLEARGFAPVWLGSDEDAATFAGSRIERNLMGGLDLRQTATVIHRSRGLIGNDSGLFHLALGLGIPGIGLFGRTDPQNTGPFRAAQALVFKAGFGLVSASLLDSATEAEIAALQRPQPMALLDPDELMPPIEAFLCATTSGVS